MPSSKLLKFLQDVAQDAKKGKAFRADPVAMMKAARLTAAQRTAVMSGDPNKIRKALGVRATRFKIRPLVMSIIVFEE